MPSNDFQFKQFRVVQKRSAMKVGMDGVLLGAWADVSGAGQILDVGTGTGLIALMLAQKNAAARIDAIETDPDSSNEAVFNVGQSPWKDRICVQKISFQKFVQRTDYKYDFIVSNPPFFTNGMKAPDENRSQARHSDSLPLSMLISGAKSSLQPHGKMAFVLPVESLSEVEKLARQNGLYISRICQVKPNSLKSVFRILIELSDWEAPIKEEVLTIEFKRHHDYTPEYRELTKDFYLKF
jgi:tRNA1Val (adenine37-N6)-methyltransferase